MCVVHTLRFEAHCKGRLNPVLQASTSVMHLRGSVGEHAISPERGAVPDAFLGLKQHICTGVWQQGQTRIDWYVREDGCRTMVVRQNCSVQLKVVATRSSTVDCGTKRWQEVGVCRCGALIGTRFTASTRTFGFATGQRLS